MTRYTSSQLGIVRRAASQIGVRFEHQGRTPGVGLDCLGLVAHAIDQKLPADYGRSPNAKQIIEGLELRANRIPQLEEPGDLAIYWMIKKTRPQHFGIFDGEQVIHSWAGAGKVGISDPEQLLAQEGWNLHSCWRLK